MTFECKDFLLLSLYRRPRSYKTVEQKTFSIFYYIIHWLCEWVYIFPFSKKYRWYFEFFFFFFQSVDDVKKHLKRWDLMHHGVKTQQSNAFGLFDYSLKAEGMLLEDVRRPPTPNHPTYTWGWRRRRSWWVEKGLLIKRGQKYLVTDRIVCSKPGGFEFWKWHFMERRRYSRPVEQGFSLYFGYFLGLYDDFYKFQYTKVCCKKFKRYYHDHQL